MCGSLLSKFKKTDNQVDPAVHIFPERRCSSQANRGQEDSACFEDRGFWKDEDQNDESSAVFSASFSSGSLGLSESDYSSQNEIEAAVRVLALDGPVLPSTNNRAVRQLAVFESYMNEERMLMETAREILACQGYGASSNSNTVATLPLSSTNSALPGNLKSAVAFDIPVGNEKITCPSARVPRRLRKRGKVSPGELTLQEVRDKLRAAEERKLKELERIRDCARSRAGVNRPHPAEALSQATKERIVAKQAAADKKRNDEMDMRSRKRISAAHAFGRTQREASGERKMKKIEEKKVKHQLKIDKKKKLKQKHIETVKETVKQGEEKVRTDLREMETHLTCDKSSGDDHENKVVYEWEDFFVD